MLLDSNIVIYGANEDEPRLDAILDRTDLAIASVSRVEVLGFHRLTDANRKALELIIGRMQVLALTDEIIERAIQLRQERKMGLADAIIAATALANNLALVTRNVDDFDHIADLVLINPFADAQDV